MKHLFFWGLAALSLSSVAQAQFGNREQPGSAESTSPFGQPPTEPQSPADRFSPPDVRDLFRPGGNLRQPLNPWELRPPAPPRPRRSAPLPNQRWDFRFDAQYQSTVKPYLRWYMRYDAENPGQRYLPHSYTEGYGDFGYGLPDSGMLPAANNCDSCNLPQMSQPFSGYGGPMPGYPTRSIYWQHLDYLYYRYGGTPIGATLPTARAGARDSVPSLTAATVTAPSVAQRRTRKSVWVARNPTSDSFSVLFVAPPEEQAGRFYKATALVHNRVRIIGLSWEDTAPEWAKDIEVADGTLKIRDQS